MTEALNRMGEHRDGRQVTYAFAKDHGVLVLPDGGSVAFRAGADPTGLLEVRRILGRAFTVESLDASAFDKALSEAFTRGPMEEDDIEAAVASRGGLEGLMDDLPEVADLLGGDDDAPVIRLINGLIFEAVKRGASDIHIDPFADHLSIRYRIDGDLTEVLRPPRKLAAPLVSRIKVMARLDIAERRLPQDGRISLVAGGRSIDVRVATLHTRYGERVALRLLDTETARVSLETLGMDAATFARFQDVLSQPNGVVLVTGPVGSGKTTTLYSALSHLNTGRGSIMTLEDPIEYGLDGISQTQMDHKVGLTFAATLRSMLRHDPNIVMVGEIRDGETADIAFEFSSAGRLALSTLHTNSSAGAITRLRDMGVEPYMMASTLRAVLAQRLVRKLCSHCHTMRPATDADHKAVGLSPGTLTQVPEAAGCFACRQTGFNGRLGVYELLVIDGSVRDMIHRAAPEADIEAHAFQGHDMLMANGLRYVVSGQTTLTELLRVCRMEARDGGV